MEPLKKSFPRRRESSFLLKILDSRLRGNDRVALNQMFLIYKLLVIFFVTLWMFFSMAGCAESRETKQTQELKIVLQKAINLEAMENYYHAKELANRKPLIIIKNNVFKGGIELSKFNQPVMYKGKSQVINTDTPYLEFTTISISEMKAVVAFVYQVEGIAGTVWFEKNGNNQWQITRSRLVER